MSLLFCGQMSKEYQNSSKKDRKNIYKTIKCCINAHRQSYMSHKSCDKPIMIIMGFEAHKKMLSQNIDLIKYRTEEIYSILGCRLIVLKTPLEFEFIGRHFSVTEPEEFNVKCTHWYCNRQA